MYEKLPEYVMNRSIYMQPHVEAEAGYQRRDTVTYVDQVKSSCKKFSFIQWLYNIIPVLKWLPNYSIRENLAGDVTAGVTVAVMHIPQGMIEHSSGSSISFIALVVLNRNGVRTAGRCVAKFRAVHGIFPNDRLFHIRNVATHIGGHAVCHQFDDSESGPDLCDAASAGLIAKFH